jgi:TonB family protein
LALLDVDGRLHEIDGVGSAISRREAVLLSLLVHALFTIGMLVAPEMPWLHAVAQPQAAAVAQPPEPLPFMMVEAMPRKVPPPERPRVASDMDRRASSPERAVNPTNPDPVSTGNSADMLDGTPAPLPREAAPSAAAAAPSPPAPAPSAPAASGAPAMARPSATAASTSLGDSLRNIDQLIKRERFDNPTGGPNANDPAISFDSKGVDFGPWLARFVAQVKRNWLIPYAALTMKGRVVVTFNVHRNGRISDLKILQGSDISAFNTAAFQALVLSNPTLALPEGYPDDVCEFKVTFFYNERPR